MTTPEAVQQDDIEMGELPRDSGPHTPPGTPPPTPPGSSDSSDSSDTEEKEEEEEIRPARRPRKPMINDGSDSEDETKDEEEDEDEEAAARPKVKVTSTFWKGSDWSQEEKAKVRNAQAAIISALTVPTTLALTLTAAWLAVVSDDNQGSKIDPDAERSREFALAAAFTAVSVTTLNSLATLWNALATWRGIVKDHQVSVEGKNEVGVANLKEAIEKIKALEAEVQSEKDKSES